MIIGVMCAYQEAGHIGPALASLWSAGCQRLIVVDGAWRWFERYGQTAGSTDGTQALARAAGAQVVDAPAQGWPDEVAARNAYLLGQPGDWYVILDADERMVGVLPGTLDDASEGAYLVWVRTDGETPLRRMRLVREDGTLRYQFAHWALYRSGHLIEHAALIDEVVIEHARRPGDAERSRRKANWYARSASQERAYLVAGRAPARVMEDGDMERIVLRYVGGGAWMPGVPARDLTESEAAAFAAEIAENMAGSRPLWERADGDSLSSVSSGDEQRGARRGAKRSTEETEV